MIRKYALYLSLFLFCIACGKEQESTIPSVPVNIRLNLDDPNNLSLTVVGGSKTIEGGLRGIIVYRKAQAEYMAFERTCSYNSNDTCAYVSIDSAISSVGCKCCGSRYQLFDGAPIKSPAVASLRAYNTSLVGRDLYIYN